MAPVLPDRTFAPEAARAVAAALVLCFAVGAGAAGASLAAQQYGGSVAVAGGHVLVGESSNVSLPGVVYVYGSSENGWTETGRLSVSTAGERPDGFGRSLDADGDLVLIGAPNWGNGRGAAMLFQAGASGEWREVARLLPAAAGSGADMGADGEAADPADANFGAAVALRGDVALVSAPGESDGAGEDGEDGEDEASGAVYLFMRDANGEWSQRHRYAPSDAGSRFGADLATDGAVAVATTAARRGTPSVALVLAVDAMAGRLVPQGRLDPTGQLAPPDPQRPGSRRFGAAVAVRDGTVLVGAPGASAGSGAVVRFAFDDEAGEWVPSGALFAFDGQPRASFGSSIAFRDGDLWIGAPRPLEKR